MSRAVVVHYPRYSSDGQFVLGRSCIEQSRRKELRAKGFKHVDQPHLSWEIIVELKSKSANIGYQFVREIFPCGPSEPDLEATFKMQVRQERGRESDVVDEYSSPWQRVIWDYHGSKLIRAVEGLQFAPSLTKLYITASVTWQTQKLKSAVMRPRFVTGAGVGDRPAVTLSGFVPEDSAVVTKKLQALQESKQRCDFVFQIGKEEIPAHRLILATMSEVFSRMFEHATHEKRTGRMEVVDATPAGFRRMLSCLYTGLEPDWSVTTDDELLELAYLAHKYEVEPLQTQCERRMVDAVRAGNVCKFIRTSVALGFREVTDFIARYMKVDSDVVKSDEWKSFCQEHPKFANELLNKLVESMY